MSERRHLSDRDRSDFAAMWNAKRSVKWIAEKLDMTERRVKETRSALGLKPRRRGDDHTDRITLYVPPKTKEFFHKRATEMKMPRATLMALALEKYARENAP